VQRSHFALPQSHVCNPSYLGGWGREDHSSRPARANSSWDPISKITRAKWTRGMALAVKYLLCKHETLSSNPSSTPKKKKNCKKDVYTCQTANAVWKFKVKMAVVISWWVSLHRHPHFNPWSLWMLPMAKVTSWVSLKTFRCSNYSELSGVRILCNSKDPSKRK
jgi:hypothetical protein